MNIMMGINNKYVFPTKVMLTSLCENNKFEKHFVYILYDRKNLTKENIESIKILEKQYEIEICPIEIDAELFANCPTDFHLSIETYFRFMTQEVLPESVDRVLWLDADIIINKCLKEFYYQDFDDKAIVVCRTSNNKAEEFLKKLELNPKVGYFNAGVILFDLDNIRKKITTQTFFDCLEENREKIAWLDQDVLNIVFADDKKLLEQQVYNFTFFSDTLFSKDELEKIKQEIYILHYIGAEKPWDSTYQNTTIKIFRHYARKQENLFESLKFEISYLWKCTLRKLRG